MRWFFLLTSLHLYAEISALYLSWYSDPTTTMTIQWHTYSEEIDDRITLYSQEEPSTLQGTHQWIDDLLVHTLSLENLQPDTEYTFQIGPSPQVYRFRTAPASLNRPLRFIVGGDVYEKTKIFRRMSQTALESRPDFVVLGGDLAYAIGAYPLTSQLSRWISFLHDYKNHMIDKDGRIIPFLIVSGNHDLSPNNYDLFFKLFAFPEKQLYRTIDFGSYLTLFLLDTGHFQPIEGRQTAWLNHALAERSSVPYRFAVYHEAAYPSFYPYQATTPKKIRTYWVPLFEKYGIPVAFEHHNHTFKRTHPIKAGRIDPTGVVYVGDGAWGVETRNTHDMWYLEKKGKDNHIWLVELSLKEATLRALNLLGEPLDELTFQMESLQRSPTAHR